MLAYRLARTSGERPSARTRADVWRSAALALLAQAGRDLVGAPELSAPFLAAADSLRVMTAEDQYP